MELLFMVAGPFLGDWGLEGWSGTYGRTATAGGGSVRSVCGWEGEPWLEFGGTEIRCCICCEEEDDEEEIEEAFAALDRGQPSVPGAERGRELEGQ